MIPLEIAELPADRLTGAALAVPLFEDLRPLDGPAAVVDWRLDGRLTRMLLAGEVSGRNREQLVLQANGKLCVPWVLLVGGGRWRHLDRDGYRQLLARMIKAAALAGIADLAICLPPHDHVDADTLRQLTTDLLARERTIACCRLSTVARFS